MMERSYLNLLKVEAPQPTSEKGEHIGPLFEDIL
jgi:hypothetical protein